MKKDCLKHLLSARLSMWMREHPTLKTQTAVAHKSGVSQRTVSRIINKDVDPSIGNLEAIAHAFGKPLTAFVVPANQDEVETFLAAMRELLQGAESEDRQALMSVLMRLAHKKQ